jgi:hypothetical protein
MESMATPCHTSMPLFLSKYHLVICFSFSFGNVCASQNEAKRGFIEAASGRRRGQARTATGIHGHPNVSPRPTQPGLSTPCGWATPKTALRSFRRWHAHRAGGLRPSSTPLDTPCHTGVVEAASRRCRGRVGTDLAVTSHGYDFCNGRMARGGHGLLKVSPGPAMPDPSTPCGWATPEMNKRPFQG